MKKKMRKYIYIGAIALTLGMTGCSRQGASDEITIFGQVKKVTRTHITVALIEEGSSGNNGSDQLVLTGKEQVAAISDKTEVKEADAQDSKKTAAEGVERGDIVTVVLDEAEAKSITIEADEADIVRKDEENGDTGSSFGEGTIELTGILLVDGKSDTSEGETITSSKENESVVLVKNGGTLNLTEGHLTKAGDTTSAQESGFFGVNAVFVTMADSESSIDDSEITSASKGANGIFAAGEGALIHASDVVISTSGDSSSGLSASWGGSVEAGGLDITTTGEGSAAIMANVGGTVAANDSRVSTEGNNSPCILAAGTVKADKVIGIAKVGRALEIEGKQAVTLTECDLSSAGENSIVFYQATAKEKEAAKVEDTAKEEETGTAKLSIADSKITTAGKGALFYISGMQAKADLEDTELIQNGETLVRVSGYDAENTDTSGAIGGEFTLTGISQKMEGDITCDELSAVTIILTDKSILKGAVNSKDKGKDVEISLDAESGWELTADSYVNVIQNKDEKCTNIKSNGYTIYYEKANPANSWLNGKTVALRGGGSLRPR